MKLRPLLALLALMSYPATAGAWDWWDYFDGLSGPGPFKRKGVVQGTFESRLYGWDVTDRSGRALTGTDKIESIMSNSPDLKWFPVVRLGVGLNNDDRLKMFDDQPNDLRHVRVATLDFAIMRRLPRTRGTVDMGAGIAVVRFAGDGFDPIYRVGFVPKVTATPLGFLSSPDHMYWSALARVPKVYAELEIMKGFNGNDFGNPNTTFSRRVDYPGRLGLSMDVQSLVWMLLKRVPQP